jgi:hypothetical protein
MQLDVERRLAIAELLSQPDPPELRHRGSRLLLEGKPDRFDLVPLFASAFVQAKLLALHERRALQAGAGYSAPVVAEPRLRKVIPFAA